MKSTLLSTRERTPATTPSFPALYRCETGDIALAGGETNGIVIYSTGKPGSWKLGHVFQDTAHWDESRSWKRLTEPVTIEFQP